MESENSTNNTEGQTNTAATEVRDEDIIGQSDQIAGETEAVSGQNSTLEENGGKDSAKDPASGSEEVSANNLELEGNDNSGAIDTAAVEKDESEQKEPAQQSENVDENIVKETENPESAERDESLSIPAEDETPVHDDVVESESRALGRESSEMDIPASADVRQTPQEEPTIIGKLVK